MANSHGYSYNFECLGRPLIQYPQDIVQVQELIARVSPDLIIETGIAHGGSIVLSASMLCLLDVMEKLILVCLGVKLWVSILIYAHTIAKRSMIIPCLLNGTY